MKKFSQLTEKQQVNAFTRLLDDLLDGIIEGAIVFNDKSNKDHLQRRIKQIAKKADQLQTPWFIKEMLMEDAYIAKRLNEMVLCRAENALFSEKHEDIINNIL